MTTIISDTYGLHHQERAIRARICDTIRAQESTYVSDSSNISDPKEKMALVKGLGPREQDHEINRRSLTSCIVECRAIRPRFQIHNQTIASAKVHGLSEQTNEILKRILTY
jgi:hypothetical protein